MMPMTRLNKEGIIKDALQNPHDVCVGEFVLVRQKANKIIRIL